MPGYPERERNMKCRYILMQRDVTLAITRWLSERDVATGRYSALEQGLTSAAREISYGQLLIERAWTERKTERLV